MAHPPTPPPDPAADAAALLRRLGFVTLFALVPIGALVARRAIVVLAPIGIVLIVLAAILDGGNRPIRPALRRLVRARALAGVALTLGWCLLSLAWTPFPGSAAERLANIAATIGLAAAGYLALPERMRSANLYVVPVGVGVAALVAIGLGLFGAPSLRGGIEEDAAFERGLSLLALLVWPAVAWLRSRRRDLEALGLAVITALALVLGPRPIPLAALAIGALVFAGAAYRPRSTTRITASVLAGLVLAAPLLPFVLRPLSATLLGSAHPVAVGFAAWRRVVVGDGLRLITGHGFETALRGRALGLVPPNVPRSLLFEVWYELGILGALATAAALFFAVRAAGRVDAVLMPGVIAAFAVGFAFTCLGIGTSAMWWFTALATVILVFVATERGQFRTERPRIRAANDA